MLDLYLTTPHKSIGDAPNGRGERTGRGSDRRWIGCSGGVSIARRAMAKWKKSVRTMSGGKSSISMGELEGRSPCEEEMRKEK